MRKAEDQSWTKIKKNTVVQCRYLSSGDGRQKIFYGSYYVVFIEYRVNSWAASIC